MSRFLHGWSNPALLGLLGLGAAGLLALAAAGAGGRASAVFAAARPPCANATGAALAPPTAAREPVRTNAGPVGGDPSRPQRMGRARKEREFLQDFLALARRDPAALEARAPLTLDGAGPAPEKVALLRALSTSGSAQALRWHEYAVHAGPDDSGPHAGSVAGYALGVLARRAEREPAARRTLLRLAFERPEPPLALRRRAASTYAGSADEGELELLRRALLRETDELLVRGALAELEGRAEARTAGRILAAFPDLAPRAAVLEE